VKASLRAVPVLLCLAAAARAGLDDEVAHALRRNDPQERCAGLIAAQDAILDSDERERNRAAAVVERALKDEPHPGVRMAAIDFLLALRTDRAMDRVVAAAVDPDPLVREHLTLIVRQRADAMLHAAIVRGLEVDESWRFRARLVDLLLAGALEAAKPVLVKALDDPHVAVRARAAEALERLTGQSLGTDGFRWSVWFLGEAARKAKEASERGETVTSADYYKKVEVHEGPIRGLLPTLYTIPIRTKRVIFAVDMSSSMHKGVRSSHLTELKNAIFGLASDVEFNVLCFDQRMFFFRSAKSLTAATTDAKLELEQWIDTLPAGEKTDVYRSVTAGLAMLREALANAPEEKGELFILTDGRETEQTTSMRAVEAQFQRLPADRCKVHVVALGQRGTPPLRELAARSGGEYVEPRSG